MITIAKDNRELFSYKFPASGLKLINDNSHNIFQLVELVAELSILNSQVLDVLLSKLEDTSCFNIDKIIAIALFEENGIIFKISNSNPFVISFNGNFTYDTTSGYFDDSKLQAFTVLDCILGS